jgi:hypothetical protein
MQRRLTLIIYYFNPSTKRFMGSSRADTDSGGNPVIPANATTVVPPELTKNQYAVWSDGDWVVEEKPTIIVPEPTAEELKNQKIAVLNAEYTVKLYENDRAYVIATRKSDTELITELDTERAAIEADYKTQMEAILNGE